ncbi:MAG: MASE3 domain-containing protein [Candidatus Accumulibacter sp.]|uniref:MASE3 domain-containing protein n=1 Tax=Accumulibacter sp. TaxID=2053492 RepID=UPI00287B41CC|nr:MASE3 domain-containing protein [Accumulibacter sp.]MDS4015410.1 MASE3 domain-containing protein [Accumulibacter sp.]
MHRDLGDALTLTDGARSTVLSGLAYLAMLAGVSGALFASSLFSYLLFHALVELATISIAGTLFILTWNSRQYLTNGYLRLLGIGYGAIAVIDLLHTLTFKGMSVIPNAGANLPTQLWIAARYLQAITLVVAPLCIGRRLSDCGVLAGYMLAVAALLATILAGIFPDCYLEGKGLTDFKIGSEYLITALLLVAMYLLQRARSHFNDSVFWLISCSLACTIVSEVCLTAYVSVYGPTNMVGHFAKLAAFYLIYRAVLVTGFKHPFQLIFRDIKQTEDALRESHQTQEATARARIDELLARDARYRSVIGNAPVVIHQIDRNGTCTMSEGKGLAALNLSPGEVVGQSIFALYQAYPDLCTSVRQALQGKRRSTSALIGGIHFEIYFSLVESADDTQELLAVAVDVSERKRMELALHEKEAAETANRAKSAFLSSVSHELRTPLNAILGFADLLRRNTGLSGDQRGQIEVIHRSGAQLLRLINDILDISRIEAGRVQLTMAPFDLTAMIDSLVATHSQVASAKGLQFHLQRSPDVPRYIRSAETRLRQTLAKLLDNAIKYTGQGSVTLRLSASPDPVGSRLRIEVADTGTGIAADDQALVFDAFVQAGASSSQQGTGLGLAITRKLVELMGGQIGVVSQPGQGSCFAIELPVAIADRSEVTDTPEAASQVLGLAPEQPEWRILISAEQPETDLSLGRLLQEAGFQVHTTTHGAETLERCRQWRPHLICLDRAQPLHDGRSSIRRIRALPGGAQLKIVALASSPLAGQRAQMLAAGIDEVLHRPFRPDEIFACLERLLGARFLRWQAVPMAATITPPSPAALATLPEALRSELADALLRLDTGRINALIRQVGERDAQLGQVLRSHADDFDFGWIEAALHEAAGKPPGSS